MARRHLYFYLLLFLTTAVLHGAWKSADATRDAVREAVKAGQKVAEVKREMAVAESKFAP